MPSAGRGRQLPPRFRENGKSPGGRRIPLNPAVFKHARHGGAYAPGSSELGLPGIVEMQGQPFLRLGGTARASGNGVFIFQPACRVFRRVAQVRPDGGHSHLRRSFTVEFGIRILRFADAVGKIRVRSPVDRRLPVPAGHGAADHLGMAQRTPFRSVDTGRLPHPGRGA